MEEQGLFKRRVMVCTSYGIFASATIISRRRLRNGVKRGFPRSDGNDWVLKTFELKREHIHSQDLEDTEED